jgi:hypothetical protein
MDPDTGTIQMIDNAYGRNEGFFTANDRYEGGGKQGFDVWAGKPYIVNIAQKKFDAVAKAVVFDSIGSLIENDNGFGPQKNLREKDDPMIKTYKKNKNKMLAWFSTGLQQGHTEVLNALRNPLALVDGVPEGQKREALTSLCARRFMLSGLAPDKAWAAGVKQANKLLPEPQQEEEQQEEPRRGVTIGGNRSPRRSGGWQKATPNKV